MDKIFDLPAHPLFSHFPIVLAPLVALAAIVIALRPAWRNAAGPVIVGASVVSLVSIFFARQSGEEMFELLNREPSIDKHEELANQSLLLWLLFVVATAAMVVLHRRGGRGAGAATGAPTGSGGSLRTVVSVLAALSILTGVVSSVWIARTGHEGAKSHWSFVDQQ